MQVVFHPQIFKLFGPKSFTTELINIFIIGLTCFPHNNCNFSIMKLSILPIQYVFQTSFSKLTVLGSPTYKRWLQRFGFFRPVIMHTWNSAGLNGHSNIMPSFSCCTTIEKQLSLQDHPTFFISEGLRILFQPFLIFCILLTMQHFECYWVTCWLQITTCSEMYHCISESSKSVPLFNIGYKQVLQRQK
jgi:hypothetical protein